MIRKSKLDELPFCGEDICRHIVLLCKSEIGIFFYSVYLANQLINEFVKTDNTWLCILLVRYRR